MKASCRGCVWYHGAWCSVFTNGEDGEFPPPAWVKDGRCQARLEDRQKARAIVLAMRQDKPISAVMSRD